MTLMTIIHLRYWSPPLLKTELPEKSEGGPLSLDISYFKVLLLISPDSSWNTQDEFGIRNIASADQVKFISAS